MHVNQIFTSYQEINIKSTVKRPPCLGWAVVSVEDLPGAVDENCVGGKEVTLVLKTYVTKLTIERFHKFNYT